MKYLIVVLLLLAVGVLIYRRLRPHIRIARQVFGAVREFRRVSVAADERVASGVRRDAPEPLARCASCGTWFPSSRALRVRASAAEGFCSAACLELRARPIAARVRPTEV